MQVEEIKIVNVDEVPYNVDDMSDTVKQLVAFYNEWRQKEADIKSDLLLAQAGMRDISREIILTIRGEVEKAEASDEDDDNGDEDTDDNAAEVNDDDSADDTDSADATDDGADDA